jgi:hypothetical protein
MNWNISAQFQPHFPFLISFKNHLGRYLFLWFFLTKTRVSLKAIHRISIEFNVLNTLHQEKITSPPTPLPANFPFYSLTSCETQKRKVIITLKNAHNHLVA